MIFIDYSFSRLGKNISQRRNCLEFKKETSYLQKKYLNKIKIMNAENLDIAIWLCGNTLPKVTESGIPI